MKCKVCGKKVHNKFDEPYCAEHLLERLTERRTMIVIKIESWLVNWHKSRGVVSLLKELSGTDEKLCTPEGASAMMLLDEAVRLIELDQNEGNPESAERLKQAIRCLNEL